MRARGERGKLVQVAVLNAQHVPRLELPHQCGAEDVEGARLRGDHPPRPEPPQDERSEAARVHDRVHGAADRQDQRVGAVHALERVEQLVFRLPRLGARDQVHQHLAVGRRLEDGALGDEVGAELHSIREVAVVREAERALPVSGEHRLRVREHRGTRGGVAGVADGDVARQPGHDLLAENVRDEPHAAVRPCRAGAVHGHHARRLLAAVLQAVEPEIDLTCCVGDAGDSDDAAHAALVSLPCDGG